MKKEEILERLAEVFQEIFDDEDIELTEDTTAEDVDDWDSLSQITLVVAVENEFDIKLNMREVNSMTNVGELVQMIMERV